MTTLTVDPADALASLLETSGMAVQEIPSGLESRTRLWRDRLAGRRILLVLDDAVGHDQVRPLLPGTAGCLMLVTSRRRRAPIRRLSKAARHREALALARATDSRPEEARALEGIGWCLVRQGEPNAAKTFLQDALAIYERIGSPAALRELEDAMRRADDQD